MILLNFEKQCIYMYKGRRAAAAAVAARRSRAAVTMVAEEEEAVSLGLIMTNTEIFHIFHIISLYNFPYDDLLIRLY